MSWWAWFLIGAGIVAAINLFGWWAVRSDEPVPPDDDELGPEAEADIRAHYHEQHF